MLWTSSKSEYIALFTLHPYSRPVCMHVKSLTQTSASIKQENHCVLTHYTLETSPTDLGITLTAHAPHDVRKLFSQRSNNCASTHSPFQVSNPRTAFEHLSIHGRMTSRKSPWKTQVETAEKAAVSRRLQCLRRIFRGIGNFVAALRTYQGILSKRSRLVSVAFPVSCE
jgi:hypothetical protein